MSGEPYIVSAYAPIVIELDYWTDATKTVGGDWTTIDTAWLAELRPYGGKLVANAAATFSVDATNAVGSAGVAGKLVLSLTKTQALTLIGSGGSFGWDLYGTTASTPVLTDMRLVISDSYTHPSGTASPTTTTPLGVYEITELGAAIGNLLQLDVFTGPVGPPGPVGPVNSVNGQTGAVDLSGVYAPLAQAVPAGGSDGQVLTEVSGTPAWAAASGSGLAVTDNGSSLSLTPSGSTTVADNGSTLTITP